MTYLQCVSKNIGVDRPAAGFSYWCALAIAAILSSLAACGESSGPDNTLPPEVIRIAVKPDVADVLEGDSVRLVVSVTDGENRPINWTATWTWSTSDPMRADINRTTGWVRGVSPGGPVTMTVTDGTHTLTARVTVTVAPLASSGTIFMGTERRVFSGAPLTQDVVSVDVVTGQETNLTAANYDQTGPAVSPDGGSVLLRGFHPVLLGYTQPLLMARDGSGLRFVKSDCVTEDVNPFAALVYCVQSPQWLADGRLAYLHVDRIPQNSARAVFVNVVTGQSTSMTLNASHFAGLFQSSSPNEAAFSPSGSHLAYQADGALFAIVVSSGQRTQLLPPCSFVSACRAKPHWHPSGQVFYVIREGSVIRVAVDGSSSAAIYSLASASPEMALSPDGTLLALADGTLKILQLNTQPVTVKSFGATQGPLAWSPDSKSIAFGVRGGGVVGSPIYSSVQVMNATGTGRRTLAFLGVNDVAGTADGLSWSR